MKVLVARTDKLGDVALSLPVFEYIRRARPDWEVHALVAPASVPLVENDPHLAAVWTWDEWADAGSHEALTQQLRAEGFDAALLLQFRRELAAQLRRAGIGRRYGPLSRWSSWLLLNRGSWQSRSRRSGHEMHYNLDLARGLIGKAPLPVGMDPKVLEPRLYLTAGQRAIGREFRAAHASGAKFQVFVHPGSGGSALDWEPERFAGVASALAQNPDCRVFVTGSGADVGVIASMREGLDPRVEILLDRFPLRDFLGVLSAGDLMIGPSTGPLHLASALGLATVGLYPPVATMSPRRWGPRGRWSRPLEPEVKCPARRICKESQCPLYNCMGGIFERDVLDAALSLVRLRDQERIPDVDEQEEVS